MCVLLEVGSRELDSRSGNGIDVTLLWDPRTNVLCVAVVDEREGTSFRFEVDATDALDAFRHPYAYADSGRETYALAG
jgi:hypothetical protein